MYFCESKKWNNGNEMYNSHSASLRTEISVSHVLVPMWASLSRKDSYCTLRCKQVAGMGARDSRPCRPWSENRKTIYFNLEIKDHIRWYLLKQIKIISPDGAVSIEIRALFEPNAPVVSHSLDALRDAPWKYAWPDPILFAFCFAACEVDWGGFSYHKSQVKID